MNIIRLDELTLDIDEVVQLLRGSSEQQKPKEEQKQQPKDLLQAITDLMKDSMELLFDYNCSRPYYRYICWNDI